ncbi:hypothetical protein [Flavobacterium johnsoniae]|uniref:Four helix bundle protein n=1 Tax=Flavobacterium johnsoniae (strain ATCC 17061 / DSM 2064 / JCM 8514 / BCRC 14874 / CCUG 350202 / NBRC 14942 / NCIMB 11054 / UW101) TaxID=376686 RepID=A5FHI5_FLAJ1|nr:hypothetical protein [Flavobacterium johnsoniae]ABQ05333.1 hypothetical protein Fjoh_2306 [Flavobacterium johnsoniae UW101]OXE94983.1 hypothetical protein B0A63_26015 [Flavobacterium johnsoniae UW101]WQG82864.1 hypothetical protein SR927_07010 [Flavobacterium johnsoniae UW101]SHL59489.1 hypothetical protein SAMN05444146_4170 [Flavobacterium johnsoniae]
MDEFLNRITAQRKVINIINKETNYNFPLVGLSSKSLTRWKSENLISDESELIKILYLIAAKLFFLANKSQEQITNEYRLLSKNVSDLINHLNLNIKNWQ